MCHELETAVRVIKGERESDSPPMDGLLLLAVVAPAYPTVAQLPLLCRQSLLSRLLFDLSFVRMAHEFLWGGPFDEVIEFKRRKKRRRRLDAMQQLRSEMLSRSLTSKPASGNTIQAQPLSNQQPCRPCGPGHAFNWAVGSLLDGS